MFARLGSEEAGTSSASGQTGVGGRGAAFRCSSFWKTCLVRWFASLFRAFSGLCSLLFSLFLRSLTDKRANASYTIKSNRLFCCFSILVKTAARAKRSLKSVEHLLRNSLETNIKQIRISLFGTILQATAPYIQNARPKSPAGGVRRSLRHPLALQTALWKPF